MVESTPKFQTLEKESYLAIKDQLPNSLFKKNRARFIKLFKETVQVNDSKRAISVFKGANEVPLYSSDVAYPEYQEAFFYYLFGVHEMDAYGVIDFNQEKAILFVPKLDNLYKIWMTVMTREDYATKYDIEVRQLSELQEYLATEASAETNTTVYVNQGVNSDSGLTTQIPEAQYLTGLKVDNEVMHDILSEARVIKNDDEILAMRWASQITAEAHVNVLKNVKPAMRESQIESFFNFHGQQNYYTGRVAPYLSICGCGPTAATLHYHDNDKTLRDGQTMLTDQGHSLHHYCSDVTISFPVNGKFTEKQAQIYSLVLKASRAVFNKLAPGINWVDMHLLAERIILEGLVELGCLTGDVQEMIDKRIGFIFQPHGLGHFIGLDCHDVGGYLHNTPKRNQAPGLKNIRTARTMQAGMVVTIEPGCYFRDFLIEGQIPKEFYEFELKYLNVEKIKEYQAEVSGVRIEDVVLVTETGCENLSHDIPRTVEEIEKCMAG